MWFVFIFDECENFCVIFHDFCVCIFFQVVRILLFLDVDGMDIGGYLGKWKDGGDRRIIVVDSIFLSVSLCFWFIFFLFDHFTLQNHAAYIVSITKSRQQAVPHC